MDNKKSIKIKDINGVEKEGELLVFFDLTSTGKDYMIYTFNEKDEHGLVKIYASEVSLNDNVYQFLGIRTDEEWTSIKEVIKNLARVGKEDGQ